MSNILSPQVGLVKSIYTNMNKLLTFEGGQPFTIEDLSFLQKNMLDSVYAVVKSLAGDLDCILYGIKYKNTSTIPGALYIGGEIYILTKDIIGTGNQYYLCINQTETEERTFRDSNTHKVHLIDDAYMSASPSAISIDLRNVYTLKEIAVDGMGRWESFGATINGTGDVFIRYSNFDNDVLDPGILVNIRKDSETVSNVLWNTGRRDPNLYSGIVISENKAYIISGSTGEGRVYNMDGSEYTGPIYINNLVLK